MVEDRLNWNQINTVFLDMDGTLLDLHFDNYFWLQHVPRRYAELREISIAEAHQQVMAKTHAVKGTLEWYCLDYWSKELGLDIALLKQEVDHLIQIHPHVITFLDAVRKAGRRIVLVTNAHTKSLELKMERTQLQGHLDRVISAHDIGVPKEAPEFWGKLNSIEPFDPLHTLFVDDTVSVMDSAHRYGIRWLVAISAPDSKAEPNVISDYQAVDSFEPLIPLLSL
jgi:5'-nucleotidase